MDTNIDMDKVWKEMAAGVISADGFLGSDSRKPGDIIRDDGAEMKRLGVDPKRLAGRMAALREAGITGLGAAVKVAPDLEVRVESDRGWIACPFGHQGVFPKTNITVRNVITGGELTFSDLNIHMMKEHGFCEGRGSVYRQEPAALVEVLGME